MSASLLIIFIFAAHTWPRTRDINLCPAVATTAIDPISGETFTVQRFPGQGGAPLADCVPQATSFTLQPHYGLFSITLALACLKIPQNPVITH